MQTPSPAPARPPASPGTLAAPSFREQLLAKLEALLLANPGATAINVDGESVSYADLYARWKQVAADVARETGKRPQTFTVDLSGGP